MRIIIAAGGTGGHIYPALTLAKELLNKGHKISFVGSTSRMEKDIIPTNGFEFIGLEMKMPVGNLLDKSLALLSMVKAYFNCKKIVKDYDMAIGFGNYISMPLILAAKDRGLKTLIHEQNSFAGKANKFLDKKVDLVIGSYMENKDTFKNPNTKIIGNPQSSKAFNVDKNPKILKDLGLDPNKKTVVIFMGSLGSQSVNKVIMNYLNNVDFSYQVIYATGKQNYQTVIQNVKPKKNICIREVVNGIEVMANSTMLVSRAGATTLSEITAMGMPSILIPSPYVPNNHQYYNALSLINKQAALMIEEKDLSTDELSSTIDRMLNDDNLRNQISKNAKTLANPDVLNEIIEEIEKI